ncbi:MAG: inorganic phosphate transporter [Chloroflexota bacterium]|nr:inorganic phosphate transporter [Chloroflexota bacterium]
MDDSLLVFIVIAAALGFGFSNGLNDAANAIATVVGSRVLSPRTAIIMAAVCNASGTLVGVFIWDAWVAKTIGKGIVSYDDFSLGLVAAAVTAAIIWVVAATRYGMPVSVTHSLVAGLLGAGLAAGGGGFIEWGKLSPVLSAVIFAPLLGFIGAYVFMVTIMSLFRRTRPSTVNGIFSRLQIVSSGLVSFSHGSNDGQMPIAIMALGLGIYYERSFEDFPIWVAFVSAGCVALGIGFGGWRVIRTVGTKITTLRPVHGFAAETSGAVVIAIASSIGIPVSTTHATSASVMGVGATKRLSAVRWGIAGNILGAWILTFPSCAILGWLLYQVVSAGS